jgi:hypothetical protein
MTDDTPISREESGAPAEAAPQVRRISSPRPKKAAKPAPKKDEAKVSSAPSFPVFDSSPPTPAPEESPASDDWPEPEAASPGASAPSENAKRKRRRKKGKNGNQSQNATAPGDLESAPQSPDEPAESAPAPQPQHPQGQAQRPSHQAQRPKLDSELLARFAWKIFLSEVSEEGVALVGDNDAKDLSRRCFRLAEIFLEEQARRR